MYAAGDGFVNPLGWSDAHVACKYGDVRIPESGFQLGVGRTWGFPKRRGSFSGVLIVGLVVNWSLY